MKITLISTEHLIISYGLRSLSSILKQNGFDVSIIFLRLRPGERNLHENIIKNTLSLCRDSDVIGISLMTNYFLQTSQLTQELKQNSDALVVWGGVHPTFCPEDCLKYADAVCIGEGDESFLELINKIQKGEDPIKTEGFYFKDSNGETIRNSIRQLPSDLDSFPIPDYDINTHFVRVDNNIVKMSKQLFERFLPKRFINNKVLTEYYITTARGCPFNCSYCATSSYKNLYKGQKYFRFRSTESVIKETEKIITDFPFIKFIYLCTDDIFSGPVKRIEEFSSAWKERIGLPFHCTCSPISYDEKKMKLLLDAGLTALGIGVQSISKIGCEVFNRRIPKDKIMSIAASINSLNMPIPPIYDFIIDNPYESDTDKLENLQFILDLPNPKIIYSFSLVPFYGTPIYDRFKEDGLLSGSDDEIILKPYGISRSNYINFLFHLTSFNFPNWIIRILSSKRIVLLFNNKFIWIVPVFNRFLPALKGFELIRKGKFKELLFQIKIRKFYTE